MQIRSFWVDVEDGDGQRLGRGPLRALSFRQTWLLSACGEFTFDISAADPNCSALAEKRVAICRYIDRNGDTRVYGGGVIDKIVTTLDADGCLAWRVSGNDLARELSYRTLGALDLSGVSAAGVLNAPEQIMGFAPTGWSITDGETLQSVYAGFDGETVLAGLARVSQKTGEHWRLGSGRIIQWLGPVSSFQPSYARAVQHINDPVAAEALDNLLVIARLEQDSDAAELATRVIPRGSGNGGVALTLSAATDRVPSGYTLSTANNYVRRDASETAYGQIERVLDFKDIGPIANTTDDVQAAANTLLQASLEYLRRYGTPQSFYRIELAQANILLRPGTTLRVVYRSLMDGAVAYDLDETLNILSVEGQIGAEGISTLAISVSAIDRLPQTDSDYLASQSINARVLSAHQQLSASVDTLTWRDELDSTHGASFPFWVGDEYTSINRALLRFRIQPLRSTVKSVAGSSTTTASGGGSTSGSGGGSTASSRSGGGQTLAGGSHLHNTTVPNGTVNKTVGWYMDGGFVTPMVATGGPLTFQVGVSSTHSHSVSDHQHEVDIPAHEHTTPNHEHSLTPSISTVYGIYEESGGNTLALTDLVIKLNGGADLRAGVLDIGNGWYQLDITDALTDAVYRPAQESNAVAITSAVAKTARIEAQLTIRGVVQAVNYD